MEIRPYKAQRGAVAVTSSAQKLVDTTSADRLATIGQAVAYAGASAAELITKQQTLASRIEEEAFKNDINRRFNEEKNKFLTAVAEATKDPSKIYQGGALDEIRKQYDSATAAIYSDTVGKIKSNRVKRKAEPYFQAERQKFGFEAEAIVKNGFADAGRVVLSESLTAAVQNGINATDENGINASVSEIEKLVGDLVQAGSITADKKNTLIDEYKQSLWLGRAKKQVDSLDHTEGSRFLADLQKQGSLSEENFGNLKNYFDSQWAFKKTVWNEERSTAFNEWIDVIGKPENLQRDLKSEIMNDSRLDLHTDVGITTDLRKSLLTYLNAEKKALNSGSHNIYSGDKNEQTVDDIATYWDITEMIYSGSTPIFQINEAILKAVAGRSMTLATAKTLINDMRKNDIGLKTISELAKNFLPSVYTGNKKDDAEKNSDTLLLWDNIVSAYRSQVKYTDQMNDQQKIELANNIAETYLKDHYQQAIFDSFRRIRYGDNEQEKMFKLLQKDIQDKTLFRAKAPRMDEINQLAQHNIEVISKANEQERKNPTKPMLHIPSQRPDIDEYGQPVFLTDDKQYRVMVKVGDDNKWYVMYKKTEGDPSWQIYSTVK